MNKKRVIVGITGGIAAYKSAELVRLLVKAGALTEVAMTKNAARFVTPLTFEALTGNRVIWDMWEQESPTMEHITWGQGADLIIIAPATANFIAKLAHGIGDDFLSTMMLAATAKVLVCPSMNSRMFLNPAVQSNLRLLEERGYVVMAPEEGALACKTDGPGRLPEPEAILEFARTLTSRNDLSGRKVLVTAGATEEPLDPVRFLTNRSSGKMGFALARASKRRGAEVILVSGPTRQTIPMGIAYYGVRTAEEMKEAVFENRSECDVIIKAAAVSDYRPRETAPHKIKKGSDETAALELVRNPDILAELGKLKEDNQGLLVGFAAETEELLANASGKLKEKNLDIIVANDVSREDSGFESDTNLVKIIYRDGTSEDLPMMTKDELADLILDRVKALWESRS
jgi:phosphopantothenoylcysteine decarboxylase/phosphopantothenate--cysteine ligase